MKLGLTQGMRQQLTMTPKMQQAIKLLHLSAMELEEEIQQALDENPILERIEYPKPPIEYSIDSFAEEPATLRDYLYWQMHLTPFSALDQQIALNIIDGIDEDGYLKIALEDIKNSLDDVTIEEITAVLHRIQQFDPIGVACRDLQECLMLQNSDPLCAEIIRQHMQLLAKHQYRQIKKIMTLNDQQLEQVITNITNLNPRPGAVFVTTNKSDYIIPDVIVTKYNEQWLVTLNPELNINLKINTSYATHLRAQLTEAKWLLNSLQTRNATLLAVASWIVKYQVAFLESGAEHMLPLRLQDIANDLSLNESTISRICSNKYLHTPRGTFGLKYFFSGQVNEGCSSTAIKAIIKNIIASEADNPLSDEEIRKHMATQNINIARRTVAKYREALGIPPSSQRKSGA